MSDLEGRPTRWEDHTSPELARLAERDPVAVLPVAAVEQHGPHLPLSTDEVIGEGILRYALEATDGATPVLVLPTLAVGASAEHEAFPGTLSLDPATLEATIFDVGASLARAGIRRLVVSNSHGGNKAVVDLVGLRLRRDRDMLVVKTSYFRFARPDEVELPEREWVHGLHGGAVETAMMMHLRPDLVRRDEVRTFPSLGQELEGRLQEVRPEGTVPFSWSAEDLSPEGVTGDATLATAELGERLVAHYGSCLAAVLRDAHRFPLERLRGGAD